MPHAPLLAAGVPPLLAVCLLAAPYCSASLVPWRLPHATLLAAEVPPLLAVCLLVACCYHGVAAPDSTSASFLPDYEEYYSASRDHQETQRSACSNLPFP